MGKVEDIYRAIRNKKIGVIQYVRPSDDELAAGVARIRQRLASGNSPDAGKQGRRLVLKIGIPAALAAAAVLLVVFYLPRRHSADSPWRYAGRPLRLNTKHLLLQHETVAAENKFFLQALSVVEVSVMRGSDSVNHIFVLAGTVLISRADATFAAVVHTKNREYRLTGTQFLLNTSGDADLVYMLEGSLQMHGGNNDTTLSANAATALRTHGSADEVSQIKLFELIKSRTDLQKLLQATSLREKAAPPAEKKQQVQQSAARFQKGDCVTYYRNNEKHRGKIHARDAVGYVISGADGLEPGRWRDGDIFAMDCE